MVSKEKDFPVDRAKESPGTNLRLVSDDKYWKQDLTNNDFLYMYKRNGIGRKIMRKITAEMFKEPFITSKKEWYNLDKEYDLNKTAQTVWLNAAISGYCVIYKAYSDVQDLPDYSKPHEGNDIPEYFYVIPRAWISEDKKQPNVTKDRDYYVIYTETGTTINLHVSRTIRISNNDEETSFYEPAFNSLRVADNILWSVGQTIWRNGQGFPVLTVDNPEVITDEDGNAVSELDSLVASGVLRDINTETGFIGDSRYKLEFKGAEGKAIKPMEYWEIVLDIISMSIDIPKDILRGISAGAVTGSETNLKDFYSMIHSKQINELVPIYDELNEALNIYVDDYDFPPILEQNQKEIAETLKIESEAMAVLIQNQVITNDVAREILQRQFDNLDFGNTVPESSSTPDNVADIYNSKNLDINHIKKQYDVDDEQILDSLKQSNLEPSALPKSIQKLEKSMVSDMGKQYRETENVVFDIIKTFNGGL